MYDQPTLLVLQQARAKIAQGWTQGAEARNAQGVEVSRRSSKAVCWCLAGALYSKTHAHHNVAEVIKTSVLPDTSVTAWNDAPGRTQAEVLAVIDAAIEYTKGN